MSTVTNLLLTLFSRDSRGTGEVCKGLQKNQNHTSILAFEAECRAFEAECSVKGPPGNITKGDGNNYWQELRSTLMYACVYVKCIDIYDIYTHMHTYNACVHTPNMNMYIYICISAYIQHTSMHEYVCINIHTRTSIHI